MMRTISVRSLVALALLGPATGGAVAAQDVSGTWVLSVELDAGSGDATFVLEQQGDSITGTYTGVLGEQRVRGTVEGNRVRFGFSEGQVGSVSFEGTVEGDRMTGTCSYGMLGDGAFSGARQGPGGGGGPPEARESGVPGEGQRSARRARP